MANAPAQKSFLKVILGGMLGLGTGAGAMYFNAAFDQLVKPAKPLANFQVTADGLTVTCENRATGQSGYWDFGDGTALEPFSAEQQTVPHIYTKPGKYEIKLLVRNFLMEEADRSVTVDVAAGGNTATNPSVTDLKVEAIRDQVPATFRITGKIANTDEIIWRLGDKTEHLPASGGTIDRYVTFDHPGQFPIVLTAFSKSRKDPQVVVETVSVKSPLQDTFEAMIYVTDTAVKSDLLNYVSIMPAPIRNAAGPTKGFSRTLLARSNCWIQKAEITDANILKFLKNVKLEVARDQKSVTISGEWAVTGDTLAQKAGGGDLMIPVSVTEERRTTMTPPRQTVSGVMEAKTQTITVKLPPRPVGAANGTRTVTLDLGYSRAAGSRVPIANGMLDAKGQWKSNPLKMGQQTTIIQAAMADDTVQITFVPQR